MLQNSCRCYSSVVFRIVTARGLCTNQNPFPKRRSKGLSTFLTAGTPLLLFLIGGSFFLSQFMDTHMELKVFRNIVPSTFSDNIIILSLLHY